SLLVFGGGEVGFAATPAVYAGFTGVSAMVVGHFRGGARPDLVVIQSGVYRIYDNQGSDDLGAVFTSSSTFPPSPVSPVAMVTADVDADGFADVLGAESAAVVIR